MVATAWINPLSGLGAIGKGPLIPKKQSSIGGLENTSAVSDKMQTPLAF